MKITNKVGAVVPTPEEQQQLATDIESLRSRLLRFGMVLAPEERYSFLKPRAGAEMLMPLVADLAREKSVTIDGMALEAMTSDLQVGDASLRIERQLEDCRQLASDTRLIAYGEAWQAFLGYYAVLNSMASRDAALANRLRPVVDFMSTGPRSKKAKE
jgi:hypothetical protein